MSGRHVARRDAAHGGSTGTLTPTVLARRGLLSSRAPAVVLAVLAAVTAAFLVVTPRVESVARDRAVGDAVSAARAQAREVGVRLAPARGFEVPTASATPGPGPDAPFTAVDAAVRSVLGPHVGRLLGRPTWAAQTDSLTVAHPDGSTLRPDGSLAVLRVQSDLGAHVRWSAGTAPGAPTTTRALDPVRPGHVTAVVPVALADATARYWGVSVGDRLVAVPGGQLTPVALEVTGTFVATDPTDGFWQAEPRMNGLAAIATEQGGVVSEGALVAAAESFSAVSDGLDRPAPGTGTPSESTVLASSWRYPLQPSRLRAADVEPLRRAVVRLATDARLGGPEGRLETTTGLPGILDAYDASIRSAQVMTSFATAGLTALTVLVLALTAVVAVARRAREVGLVRARGASLRRLVGHVVGGTALPALPVAALAVAASVLLVRGTTGSGAWLEVAAVTLVPALAAAVAVLVRVHTSERDDSAEEPARRRRLVRTARRVVAELAVVALAAAAVSTVRTRGSEIAGGRTDWTAALTPVLVAAVAALLVLRLLPWPVRVAAGLAARRRGLVGFLGLARAARTGATAALPVLAVVVGAAVLALLAALGTTVAQEREVAAYRSVGAPVRVDAVRVDADDLAALEARPGVGTALPAYVATGNLVSGSRATPVSVVGVDPRAYAALVRGTPAEVTALPTGGGDRIPAVLGPLAGVSGDVELAVRGTRVPVRVVGHDPGLVRVGGGQELPAVLVPLDRLGAEVPSATATSAFLTADADAARALVSLRDPGTATPSGRVTGVDTVAAASARVADRALSRLVTWTFLVGAVLAGVLTLLAVVLLLVATRPDRAALVVRLRTMGLPHGAERSLAWTEVMPVVGVAALAGGLVGAVAPTLVAAAVDLGPFTGGAPFPPLPVHPVAAVGAGLLVIVLGALALVLDAAAARRGRLADHLRKGDTA